MTAHRLRIVSDGTHGGSHVYDAETGDEISGVRAVTVNLEVGQVPTATVELAGRFLLDTVASDPRDDVGVDVTGFGDKYRTYERVPRWWDRIRRHPHHELEPT